MLRTCDLNVPNLDAGRTRLYPRRTTSDVSTVVAPRVFVIVCLKRHVNVGDLVDIYARMTAKQLFTPGRRPYLRTRGGRQNTKDGTYSSTPAAHYTTVSTTVAWGYEAHLAIESPDRSRCLHKTKQAVPFFPLQRDGSQDASGGAPAGKKKRSTTRGGTVERFGQGHHQVGVDDTARRRQTATELQRTAGLFGQTRSKGCKPVLAVDGTLRCVTGASQVRQLRQAHVNPCINLVYIQYMYRST